MAITIPIARPAPTNTMPCRSTRPKIPPGVAPQREAYAEFAAAIAHQLGENTIQSRNHHKHRHPRESAGEIKPHSRTEIALVHGLLHGLKIVEGIIRGRAREKPISGKAGATATSPRVFTTKFTIVFIRAW